MIIYTFCKHIQLSTCFQPFGHVTNKSDSKNKWGILGIEPRASHIFEFGTQSENHTTRPHARFIKTTDFNNNMLLILISLFTT